MLADALATGREQVLVEVESRADTVEGPGFPALGRRQRLNALLEELIKALTRGSIDEQAPSTPTDGDPEIECSERETLRRFLLEKIAHDELQASTAETALVSEWPSLIERRRLEEENRRLRVLLDGVEEGAALLEPTGRILYVNRHTARVIFEAAGVPPDKIVGKNQTEFGLPAELGIGRARDEIMSLARTRARFETVVWGRAKENQFEALYSPDGTVAAIAVVIHDIQARKLAQNRLSMQSKLGALIGTLDYDEVAEALAHVPIPELADWCAVNIIENKKIRQSFVAQVDPAKAHVRDALMRAMPEWDRHPLWQEMLTGGYQLLSEVSDDMLRGFALDDERYRLLSELKIRSLMVMPIVSRGRIAGIITFAYTAESGRRYGRDDPGLAEELAVSAAQIVETARLLKELKSSETRFRIALAGARTSVFEQDRALRYLYFYNPGATWNPVGKSHEEAFPSDQAARLTQIKKHVVETGESAFEELDLTVGEGGLRHCREAVEALRDRAGRIVGVIGSATDITEQQRARQQLSEMVVFRERMAGVLGHDLRNPLTTISMADGLLLNRTDLPPDAHNQAVRIRRAANRMQEMINTLLDFTRARFLGQIPVSPAPADLGQIARDAVDDARVASTDRKLEVEVAGDPHGTWDPGRMAQIISNLVDNAIAYGDPKTPVRVSVDSARDDVVLQVHSEGPPIPPDVVPVLFEPFRRGAEDRSPRGLGLGLYIVQQLVQAHHGTISVQSTEKEGTTFTIKLPRSPPQSDRTDIGPSVTSSSS
jgi:signal transduction histidine kinase/GAF domain-containing protein